MAGIDDYLKKIRDARKVSTGKELEAKNVIIMKNNQDYLLREISNEDLDFLQGVVDKVTKKDISIEEFTNARNIIRNMISLEHLDELNKLRDSLNEKLESAVDINSQRKIKENTDLITALANSIDARIVQIGGELKDEKAV